MKKSLCTFISFLAVFCATAQTNIHSTSPIVEQILLGNYNPVVYKASKIINDPTLISRGINSRVSADSLYSYLNVLRGFKTRNTLSDTISEHHGIGAARKWAFSKFQQFGAQNDNRLITSYLEFDIQLTNCPTASTSHKNIFAVLPGANVFDKSVIIIEAHFDSRCKEVCDTTCLAEGMEDNGSGSALVLELARVMSKYTYDHTIAFLLTTGEEQGLIGAKAFANYAQQKDIQIKAVMNNDVIGGIICGKTASSPGCPGLNHIDSTQVRLFSAGTFNSPNKGLTRFIKLQYEEMIKPFALVPMNLTIMTLEDRTGRSGDHIPFRELNYAAMRFTSANENGDATVKDETYTDRQHTSADILGIDTNNDQVLDSFYVDFNYLARNTVINGNAAAMMALGPKSPDFILTTNGINKLYIQITEQTQYLHYRVGIRTTTNDWDTIYTFSGSRSLFDSIPVPIADNYIVSVASVDRNGIESLFSKEYVINLVEMSKPLAISNTIQLLQNKPNITDEATTISVLMTKPVNYKQAYIVIKDMAGKELQKLAINLKKGVNEVMFAHGYQMSGILIYSLVVDGKNIESKRMIFTN